MRTETLIVETKNLTIKVVHSTVLDEVAAKRGSRMRGKMGGDTIMEVEMPPELSGRPDFLKHTYTVTILDVRTAAEARFTLDAADYLDLLASLQQVIPRPYI